MDRRNVDLSTKVVVVAPEDSWGGTDDDIEIGGPDGGAATKGCRCGRSGFRLVLALERLRPSLVEDVVETGGLAGFVTATVSGSTTFDFSCGFNAMVMVVVVATDVVMESTAV